MPPSLLTAAVVTLLVLSSAAHAELDNASLVRLQTLQQSPAQTGELIYKGDTYAQQDSSGQPLFRYERRIATTPAGLTASHLTRNPAGELIVIEAAQVGSDYALQRFETVNQQSDFSGSVEVSADGRQLHYSLLEQGEVSSADEQVDEPVVAGPSMHGFILQHWDQLKAGSSLPVRFVVLQEKQTYGFDIRFDREAGGQTVFSVTPSSFLIRLAIQPLQVTFDTSAKTVVRYEGRVPPKQQVDGELKDLDARVEYTAITPSYR
jgi:hypothetical protein